MFGLCVSSSGIQKILSLVNEDDGAKVDAWIENAFDVGDPDFEFDDLDPEAMLLPLAGRRREVYSKNWRKNWPTSLSEKLADANSKKQKQNFLPLNPT